MARRLGFVTATLFAIVLGGVRGADARPWALTDFGSVAFIDDVQISPNGTVVLVAFTKANLAKDSWDTEYDAVRLEDGTRTKLPIEAEHPRWSPDGASIAWLKTSDKGAAEIVITSATAGNPRALDLGGNAVAGFAWSPDGSRIALTEMAGGAAASGVSRLRWLTPESDIFGTQPPQRTLWVLDVATGAQHRIVSDSWSYGGPAADHDPSWSSDGKRLAVVRQPTPVFDDFSRAQYAIVDVDGGTVRTLLDRPYFAYPGSAAPAYAPSGDAVAYVRTWDDRLPSREDAYVDGLDVSAKLDRDLWSCGNGAIAWRGDRIVASLLDGVSARLFSLDRSGGIPQALTPADGTVEGFSVAATGRIAYAWTTPERLPELYVLDPGGAARQVTRANAVPEGLAVAATRVVTWQSDGHLLHGQLTLPAGDLSRAPVVVEPHGGPQCADDSSFSPFAQYLATNGYAYFRPDPRGSDGYGDWSYKDIVLDWGAGPMHDLLTGTDAVAASGVGDSKRTFIEGGSYGGYLTSWVVTHDDRFRAAVAEVPVTDLLFDYALSEDANLTQRFFGVRPVAAEAALRAQSPLTFAAHMKTPLLIVSGLADTRAPYPQAIEFYKVLAELGAPVSMLVDPKAGHGPADPQGVLDWWGATAAWIGEHGGIAIPDAKLPAR
ncbi:MAG: S9 family peptidase [Candidatus Tumulicola sp.]